jgi:hypothetical protein
MATKIQSPEVLPPVDTRYSAAAIIGSPQFASYPKPVMRALLKNPDYTISEAEEVLNTYLGIGGN